MNYIKLIHMAKNKAKLNDEEYRALLWGAAGVSSSKEIKSAKKYNEVRKAFHQLGVSLPYANSNYYGNDAQDRKAYALWCDLHEAGAVRDKSWKAMISFRTRQFSGQDIINTAQASQFIEMLKSWLERVEQEAASGIDG